MTQMVRCVSCVDITYLNFRIPIPLTPAFILFKMDWVMMSIVILCVLATALYSCINMLEKQYRKKC